MYTPKPIAKLEFHIFVCTNERPPGNVRGCCKEKGSELLVQLFKKEIAALGSSLPIRAQKAGCLDVCEAGPVVVVYPEGIWYGPVKEQDVAEIVSAHLLGGQPVARLRIPGK